MDDRRREDMIQTSFQITEEGKKFMFEHNKRKVKDVDNPAHYNSLTKLPVLRLFFYEADEIVNAQPYLDYAVLVMDITQFKAVNEFLGRREGDRVLIYIGSILEEYVQNRPFTAACHMRADNFCLFTGYRDEQELADIAVDIRQRLLDMNFAFRIVLSIGICASRDDRPSVSYLKDCATLALAEVKGKFYADYKFFHEDMRRNMLRDKAIEGDMIEALTREGEIVPFIQPKVDMSTGEIVGGEALVRWLHPEKGLIGPNLFIPVIEKDGLIIDVDKRVWRQVFEYQRRVVDEGRDPVPVSVNISRMHAHDNKLEEILTGFENEYGLGPGKVVLELTESAYAVDEEGIQESMRKLRERGYMISMDDFGSGYSSLNMLKTRVFDEVKLDKEFLSDMNNNKSRIVIRHLISMLHELGVGIMVEGIETQEQIGFLLENGCRCAQGFYYYRPMPLEDFDALLRQQERGKADVK